MSQGQVDARAGGALAAESRTVAAVTGIGSVLSVAAGWVVAGPAGALAGGVLVAAWLVASPIVVVALGHVLFAALLPSDAALATLAIAEVPLVIVFLGSVVDRRTPLRTSWIGIVALAALSAVVAGGLGTLDAHWQTAAVLVAVVALAGYGLHRFTVATLEVSDEY